MTYAWTLVSSPVKLRNIHYVAILLVVANINDLVFHFAVNFQICAFTDDR